MSAVAPRLMASSRSPATMSASALSCIFLSAFALPELEELLGPIPTLPDLPSLLFYLLTTALRAGVKGSIFEVAFIRHNNLYLCQTVVDFIQELKADCDGVEA
jgi:hypothetical protein